LNSHSNGLSYLVAKMQGHPLYAHINLEKGERSRLADLASMLL
jgi:PhoH-like ATPase